MYIQITYDNECYCLIKKKNKKGIPLCTYNNLFRRPKTGEKVDFLFTFKVQ